MAKEWTTLEISTDPLLEPIQPTLDTLVTVLDYLITILNIAQKILNIVKAFLVGFLDPIRAIVERIIQEVRDIIQDLRQLGVYISGDWKLVNAENKHSFLLGGYQAYERRMLSRLLDTDDPNRPDFTSASVALGVFLYVSSGDITEIIRIIRMILKFLGQDKLMGNSMPYGTPTAPEMKYGSDGAGLAAFRQLGGIVTGGGTGSTTEIPEVVSVSWTMPAGTGGIGQSFSPPPAGFLIHVATVQEGFQVIGLTPKTETSGDVEDLPRVVGAALDPVSNGSLRVYGGVADVSSQNPDYSDVINWEDPTASLLCLQLNSNTPLILPSTLIVSGKPVMADTFFVKTNLVSKLGAGTTFTATFPRSILPQHVSFKVGEGGFAEIDEAPQPASTYWFRIRAVTQTYVDSLSVANAGTFTNPISIFAEETGLFYFNRPSLWGAVNGKFLPWPTTAASGNNPGFTPASSAGVAQFPAASQMNYISAVQTALALAILCRADLTEASSTVEDFQPNTYVNGQGLRGLEGAGRDLIARYGITPTWFKGTRPSKFRRKMRVALDRIAADIMAKGMPPEALCDTLEPTVTTLLEFLWSDIHSDYGDETILESLGKSINTSDKGVNEQLGVGGNPYCRMQPRNLSANEYEILNWGPTRSPSFSVRRYAEDTAWYLGDGSADLSPILFNNSTHRVRFVRNEVAAHDDGELLTAASKILQLAGAYVARPDGDSQWIALRLMENGLVPLDDLLDRLDRFMQAVLDGLTGLADKIIAYIEAIQARINQLQALLNKIKAILESLSLFRIGPVAGLVLVESGTDGLVSGLLTAENKPVDSAASYGGGIAIVAGGLPSVLLETLAVLFRGDE